MRYRASAGQPYRHWLMVQTICRLYSEDLVRRHKPPLATASFWLGVRAADGLIRVDDVELDDLSSSAGVSGSRRGT
jgi:hypothetical protein